MKRVPRSPGTIFRSWCTLRPLARADDPLLPGRGADAPARHVASSVTCRAASSTAWSTVPSTARLRPPKPWSVGAEVADLRRAARSRHRDAARRRRHAADLPAAHRPPRARVGDRSRRAAARRRDARRRRRQGRGARRRSGDLRDPRAAAAARPPRRGAGVAATRRCSRTSRPSIRRTPGLLALGTPRFVPSTPGAAFHMLDRYMESIGRDPRTAYDGLDLVLVGRSNNVGKPAAILGLARNATVISCHKHTADAGRLAEHTRLADILIVAVGRAGPDHRRDGARRGDRHRHRHQPRRRRRRRGAAGRRRRHRRA